VCPRVSEVSLEKREILPRRESNPGHPARSPGLSYPGSSHLLFVYEFSSRRVSSFHCLLYRSVCVCVCVCVWLTWFVLHSYILFNVT
jgi:hypothetical protein